eukprot:CAMPEP_0117762764 /NCGR_PEP_ID=MMETSP0947-20121206/18164_1 /TAXON_ID=44440 /ORGANISM="Chattonella subsalsa, Strain CCMP2191" /LENGTH=1652 /DNA_ID=CAMNT_0005584197 /DNA_START=55 /DNA_END=5013 /DNA_ORIENTATION=-
MGVPKFYRWLSERYPLINQLISDETLLPEFDNLYLDMNGILHNCSHPNDNVASQLSDRDIMLGIFAYIDRIVTQIVRPKKVLFLAVDGCAPRAKLNQQRSRRFRSAKDAQELKLQMLQRGEEVNDKDVFDSNCITPGTEWMAKVSDHLKYFIRKKIKEDPLWQGLTIVYSGMDVPGEGEHKIMNYIRHQRTKGVFHPNTRHCMYGQDADLVMLGLITHEPHFTLLREVIDFSAFKRRGGPKMRQTDKAQFQLLHLSVLREYLHLEFTREMPASRPYDSERLIDDFVFLTFLVGNDFLPHMPSLDIGEHAFDKLFNIYRTMLVNWGSDYLTENGKVPDPDRLEQLLVAIGELEDEIFEERAAEVESFNRKRRDRDQRFGGAPSGPSEEEQAQEEARMKAEVHQKLVEAMGDDAPSEDNLEFKTRYYMEKLGISPKHEIIHDKIRQSYIEGLLWCLAYYYEGCVSWGWFYPYHYGPLISDLTDIRLRFQRINFSLGRPFLPFFQLLGCLPPASSNFLPRPYQRLMTDQDSPIIDFYPEDFKIDMNGKRNPWEAVNLLPFIDERRMTKAIEEYCPETLLSAEERNRNRIGQILLYYYDQENAETVRSCNPEIGLPDISRCASSVINLDPSAFDDLGDTERTSALRKGVTIPLPGFPSLGSLPKRRVEVKSISVNCFGSGSRYHTMVLDLLLPDSIPSAAELTETVTGRSVFVNWPNLHEAKIVGVKDREVTANIEEDKQTGQPYVTSLENDEDTAAKYDFLADDERRRYLSGRELPGTGGLEIGPVTTQLVVRPLQGMRRDKRTGATSKVFGKQEATIPYQLCLWENPCPDPRFDELDQQPLEQRAPIGGKVVHLKGKMVGLTGVIESHNDNGSVNIITKLRGPEPPFGLNIARSIQDKYADAHQISRALNIRGDVFGKLVGSVRIEPGRIDIGLNIKWNGRYQTLGFSKCNLDTKPSWATEDAVKVVGSEEVDEHFMTGRWQYSIKTGQIISEYQQRFPMVFHNLTKIPHAKHYTAKQILGENHEEKLRELQDWLKHLPTASLPRTPLSTIALSAEAVKAIQRAADVRTAEAANKEPQGKVMRGVFPDAFEVEGSLVAAEVLSERAPKSQPELGVRVCSLTSPGVPFGLWGTVVAIHPHSACIEVLFDEEFMGGTSLSGLCANHRGKLLPWSSVVVVSSHIHDGLHQQQNSLAANQPKRKPQQQSLKQMPKVTNKAHPQVGKKNYRQINSGNQKKSNGADQAKDILAKSLGIRQQDKQPSTKVNLQQPHQPKPNSNSSSNGRRSSSEQMKIHSGPPPPGKGLPDHAEINALMGKWQAEMNVHSRDFPAHHTTKRNSGGQFHPDGPPMSVGQLEAEMQSHGHNMPPDHPARRRSGGQFHPGAPPMAVGPPEGLPHNHPARRHSGGHLHPNDPPMRVAELEAQMHGPGHDLPPDHPARRYSGGPFQPNALPMSVEHLEANVPFKSPPPMNAPQMFHPVQQHQNDFPPGFHPPPNQHFQASPMQVEGHMNSRNQPFFYDEPMQPSFHPQDKGFVPNQPQRTVSMSGPHQQQLMMQHQDSFQGVLSQHTGRAGKNQGLYDHQRGQGHGRQGGRGQFRGRARDNRGGGQHQNIKSRGGGRGRGRQQQLPTGQQGGTAGSNQKSKRNSLTPSQVLKHQKK